MQVTSVPYLSGYILRGSLFRKDHVVFFFSSLRLPSCFLKRVQICEQSVSKCKRRIIAALTARMYTREDYLASDRASLIRFRNNDCAAWIRNALTGLAHLLASWLEQAR
jgi:hypothetical protein